VSDGERMKYRALIHKQVLTGARQLCYIADDRKEPIGDARMFICA
jgi:hypothetical protein